MTRVRVLALCAALPLLAACAGKSDSNTGGTAEGGVDNDVSVGVPSWSGIDGGSAGAAAEVQVTLLDVEDLRATAKYAQIAVFEGKCPSDSDLAYGNLEGAVLLKTTLAEMPFDAIGELEKATFGFAALLRRDDCAVLGVGCTLVDLRIHRRIAIQIDPIVLPLGACDASKGKTCQEGVCSP